MNRTAWCCRSSTRDRAAAHDRCRSSARRADRPGFPAAHLPAGARSAGCRFAAEHRGQGSRAYPDRRLQELQQEVPAVAGQRGPAAHPRDARHGLGNHRDRRRLPRAHPDRRRRDRSPTLGDDVGITSMEIPAEGPDGEETETSPVAIVQLRQAVSILAPRIGGGPTTILTSANGRRNLIAWEEAGEIRYRENDGGPWTSTQALIARRRPVPRTGLRNPAAARKRQLASLAAVGAEPAQPPPTQEPCAAPRRRSVQYQPGRRRDRGRALGRRPRPAPGETAARRRAGASTATQPPAPAPQALPPQAPCARAGPSRCSISGVEIPGASCRREQPLPLSRRPPRRSHPPPARPPPRPRLRDPAAGADRRLAVQSPAHDLPVIARREMRAAGVGDDQQRSPSASRSTARGRTRSPPGTCRISSAPPSSAAKWSWQPVGSDIKRASRSRAVRAISPGGG